MVLKQDNAKFVTYELNPGNYTIDDFQKAAYPLGDHEGTLQIEFDELNKKTKHFLTRFGSTFGTLSFDGKSLLNNLLGFTAYWDYKLTNAVHADSPVVYTSDNFFLNLNTIDKTHLKCDVNDGSVVNGVRVPILFSFVSDKKPGFKVFCQPETIHFKKLKKSVLNTATLYLEDINNELVDFNGETLTFTLQTIKI